MRDIALAVMSAGLLASVECQPALAGPHQFGTFIVHARADLAYTSDHDGYCGQSGLASCEDARTTVPADAGSRVWHVLAAFLPESSPRLTGVTFGVEFPADVQIIDHGHCGDFALEYGEWPASETGLAVIWFSPRTTSLVEAAWFGGYCEVPGTVFSLIPHPTQGGTFSDDSTPAVLDSAEGYGALGFGQPGSLLCPVSLGACCFEDGTCERISEAECSARRGEYQGDGIGCAEVECEQPPPPTGACCVRNSEVCIYTDEDTCRGTHLGIWHGVGSPCEPSPCPPVGACCGYWGGCFISWSRNCAEGWWTEGGDCDPFPCPIGACCLPLGNCGVIAPLLCNKAAGEYLGDGTTCDPDPCDSGACCDGEKCTIYRSDICDEVGGVYLGDEVPCDPNPCLEPVPVERRSWGEIKRRYR
ncbi:MAG: hypothetical protein IT349_05890 [Candidatus Eisenbacteria bacterium]|nr:hypothetical protein [Candidatus Eisenbacteria bacterium]